MKELVGAPPSSPSAFIAITCSNPSAAVVVHRQPLTHTVGKKSDTPLLQQLQATSAAASRVNSNKKQHSSALTRVLGGHVGDLRLRVQRDGAQQRQALPVVVVADGPDVLAQHKVAPLPAIKEAERVEVVRSSVLNTVEFAVYCRFNATYQFCIQEPFLCR